MAVTTNAGGTMITGADVHRFRYITILSGLKLEANTGMTLSRGRSCFAMAKDILKEAGLVKLPRTKKAALPVYAALLLDNGILSPDSAILDGIQL